MFSVVCLLHPLQTWAVHAAQRMDGDGDSQWVVPGDPRSETTFRSLAECEVASVWVRETESHPTTGQVASGAHQGQPRGGVGECQEARFRIGGCHLCHDCQWHRREVFRGDIVERFSGKGEAECPRAQCVDSIERGEGVRRAELGSGWLHTMPNVQCWRKSWSTAKPGCNVWRRKLPLCVPGPQELDAEVSQLKAKLAMMEAEQQRLREGAARSLHAERMTDEVPSVAGIPPLP